MKVFGKARTEVLCLHDPKAVSEDAFQSLVIAAATQNGWLAYHTHDSRRSQAGFPDLVLVHQQLGVVYAELKSEKGKVSPAQQHWLLSLTLAGQAAFVWKPSDWAQVRKILEGEGKAK